MAQRKHGSDAEGAGFRRGFQRSLQGRISDPEGPDNVIGFAGSSFDHEAQLHAMRYRCMDPALGRFITRDPAGYTDGMSLYEYVGSSPFVLVDPMGLTYFAPAEALPGPSSGPMDAQFYHPGGTTLPREDALAFNAAIARGEDMERFLNRFSEWLPNKKKTRPLRCPAVAEPWEERDKTV